MATPFRLTVLAALLAIPGVAAANGRLAGPTNLRFHPTDPNKALLGATFGMLDSTDAMQTWNWVCEQAIGYGGEYDPDYVYHPTRDEIWSTTFEGLRVSKDGGCTWSTIGSALGPIPGSDPPVLPWIGEVEIDPGGRVWAATSTGTSANDVYVSVDGVEFTSVGLLDQTGWWESIKFAPSNGDVVYVTGYRMGNPNGTPPTEEDGYIRKSTNGGQSWSAPLPETGITFGNDPRMMVLGVSPVDPDVVFLRVLNAVEPLGDALYRSADGGQSWALVQQLNAPVRGFAISPDGTKVFVGTAKLCADDPPRARKGCLYRSTDSGANFAKAGYHPRIGPDNTPNTSNALAYGPDGALYSGGNNGIDGWLLGKSTDDGDTFVKVLALNEIEGPLACPALDDGGTTEQRDCAALIWPALCVQSFICPVPSADAGPLRPDANTGGNGDGNGGGCCSVSPGPRHALVSAGLALVVLAVLVRRRRR